MFALTDRPIEEHPLRQGGMHNNGGALVLFEGHVRPMNKGREVSHMEYEGAEALAANEFARIERECLDRYDVLEIQCVHRTGTLHVGDMAVWIAVLAAHRAPAFDACRYIIDELKQRLPLWKKEFYSNGTSEWLNTP